MIGLRSGYDMPLDSLQGFETMPSIYCDVSVGIKPSAEYHADTVRSSTCMNTRNPVWNESLSLNL